MAQEINGAPGQRTAQRSGLRKPSAPIGVLTSRHKKELRNTLASAGAREPIFSACREPRPQDNVCFAGRASRPQAPHPSAVRAFEPWCPTPGFATLALAQVPRRRCERCRRSQSRQDRRCGWVGARFARRIPTGRLGRFSAFRGHTAPPSELPIAIGMDKTGIANTKQSLQFLDCLGDYAARPAGLELALQLNENLISAI